jgi:hypothetical protein
VGNTPKKRTDRRAAVEELRRAEQAARRRRTIVLTSVTAVVVLGLIGAVAVPALQGRRASNASAVAELGTPLAQAGCRPPIPGPGRGANDHVNPGVTVHYPTAPPASGRHDGQYITDPRHFYTAQDRPPVEKLVHSLEHGYTVVWYDPTVRGGQLDALRELAGRLPTRDNPGRWFIVAPWTSTDEADRGRFPTGTHVALTHWGAKGDTRQYCARVSGQAVLDFVAAHPAADAPEPGGA